MLNRNLVMMNRSIRTSEYRLLSKKHQSNACVSGIPITSCFVKKNYSTDRIPPMQVDSFLNAWSGLLNDADKENAHIYLP